MGIGGEHGIHSRDDKLTVHDTEIISKSTHTDPTVASSQRLWNHKNPGLLAIATDVGVDPNMSSNSQVASGAAYELMVIIITES